jgi:hypothetical protein
MFDCQYDWVLKQKQEKLPAAQLASLFQRCKESGKAI